MQSHPAPAASQHATVLGILQPAQGPWRPRHGCAWQGGRCRRPRRLFRHRPPAGPASRPTWHRHTGHDTVMRGTCKAENARAGGQLLVLGAPITGRVRHQQALLVTRGVPAQLSSREHHLPGPVATAAVDLHGRAARLPQPLGHGLPLLCQPGQHLANSLLSRSSDGHVLHKTRAAGGSCREGAGRAAGTGAGCAIASRPACGDQCTKMRCWGRTSQGRLDGGGVSRAR